MNHKTVLISTLFPETNYSDYLCKSFDKLDYQKIIVYTNKNSKNIFNSKKVHVKKIWSKNIFFIPQIISEIIKDKPKNVHIQHEFNMYGSPLTSVLFPFLILALRILHFKTIVTIHAVVSKKNINDNFISSFFYKKNILLNKFFIKGFFKYLFFSICFFSNKIIVHTNFLKKILTTEYCCDFKKIYTIPMGVPFENYPKNRQDSKNYFLYFGYLVKRKGLENVILGFKKFIDKNKNAKFKLILAGGVIKGQEFAEKEIKKIVKNLKIENNIIITGFVDKVKIKSLFLNAYAIIIPSVFSISASGPLAQGFSFGKCCLVSNVDNLKTEIINNKTGLLVNNNSWEESFFKIYKNKKLVNKIEINTFKVVKKRSWENVAKKHIQIYNQA